MKKNPTHKTVFLCTMLLAPLAAHAYVGPGAGLSLLGALWALLVAVGAAIVFIVAWPLRRMRRRKREAMQQSEQERATEARGSEPPAHPATDDDDDDRFTHASNVTQFERPPANESRSR